MRTFLIRYDDSNAWFRLKPKITADPKTRRSVIQFQHPVSPGNNEGGWMARPAKGKEYGGNEGKDLKTFSLEEIGKHHNEVPLIWERMPAMCALTDSQDDAWIIIENKVYDVTSVLSWHPGGAKAILAYAGKATMDVTNQVRYSDTWKISCSADCFLDIVVHGHSRQLCVLYTPALSVPNLPSVADAHSKRDECLIGVLSLEGMKAMQEDAVRAAQELAKVKSERKDKALQPDVFTQAKLIRKTKESHDTRYFV